MNYITSFLLLTYCSLQANTIEDTVQQAIGYAQNNNKIAAKELLTSVLDQKISEEDRAVILYNLASLSLQEQNLSEAERIFQQLTLMKAGPELSYCININYAITLLLHAKTDLDQHREAAIGAIKKQILLAEVYIKKAQRASDTQTTDALSQIAAVLLKKANQNEFFDRLKRSAILDTASLFGSALQPFIDGLIYLPNGSHSQFVQGQADLLDNILFFYCNAMASYSGIKEIEAASNSIYLKTKSLAPEEVLQQLLFLQFLLRQAGAADPLLEALSCYYESSLLTAPEWQKQQEKRKEYIIFLVKKIKGSRSQLLINAIHTLSAQDLLTYYNLCLLDPNTLFTFLLEKKGDQPITLLALKDSLTTSPNPQAKNALKYLSADKPIIDAFAHFDFMQAIEYLIKKIDEDSANRDAKKSLLHLFQQVMPNTTAALWCKILLKSSDKDDLFNTSLAWINYFASDPNSKEKKFNQSIVSSINYTHTIATQIPMEQQSAPQKEALLLIDSSTENALRELHLKESPETIQIAVENLIKEYEDLQKNRFLPVKNHVVLLKKVKSMLDDLQKIEKSSIVQKNSDKETPAVQDSTTSPEEVENSAFIEKTIGEIQEMQKQDAPFDEKNQIETIPSQVKRPW